MKNELLAPNGKPSNLTAEQYKLVRSSAFKKWFGDWENDPANASKVVDENGEPLVVYRGMPKKRRFGNIFNYNVNLFIENRKKNKFAFYFSRTKEEAEIYGFQSAEYNDDDYIVKEYFLKINNLFLAVKKDSVASKSKININSSRPNRFNLYDKPIPEIDKELGKGYLTFKELFDLAKPNKKDFELLNTEYTDNEDAKKEYEEEQERVSAKPIYWHFIDISKNDKKQDFWRNYLKDIKKYDGLMFYEDTHALTFTGRGKNEKAILQFLDNPNTICVFEPNQIKLADGTNTIFDSGNADIRFAKGGKTKGDCYLVAGQIAMEIRSKKIDYKGTPYLVHAEVRHSQIDGLRYGHAFIEDDENVYDFSNNREIIMPKQIYYYFGDINPRDKKKYRKYTFKQAREKMLSTGNYGCWDIEVDYKNGGRTIAQTPAPKKDRVYGSNLNKSSSSKNLSNAKLIKFDDKTLLAIKNKVKEHNEEHPDKKINLSSAKAVVRRGFGAYSKSHRPTISGGKPNSRVAWGLARLNAFTFKIVNGKSKSGKYSQDDDLIEELGYKVANYKKGGEMSKDIRCINCGWEWNKKDSELWDMYVCHKCGFDNTTFYTSIPVNNYSKGGKVESKNPDYLKMFLGK